MKTFLLLFGLYGPVSGMACDQKSIICKTICIQDGDEKGLVIDGKCYCANYRSLDKIITRVPTNGGYVADKKAKYLWDN